ncbi:MAG: hypothetical protein ACI4MB_04135 [Candidatus Coproplasma sp.]
MIFDIVDITEDEVDLLTTVQKKLLRTAQQKKNEMVRKRDKQLFELKIMLNSNNMENSSIYSQMEAEIQKDYQTELDVLVEQLQFNMSLREPTSGDETGDSGMDNTGYVVDYELSYLERYISVRDYYLTIEDPNERIALLQADTVAQEYLGTYYSVLYDYLMTLT